MEFLLCELKGLDDAEWKTDLWSLCFGILNTKPPVASAFLGIPDPDRQVSCDFVIEPTGCKSQLQFQHPPCGSRCEEEIQGLTPKLLSLI